MVATLPSTFHRKCFGLKLEKSRPAGRKRVAVSPPTSLAIATAVIGASIISLTHDLFRTDSQGHALTCDSEPAADAHHLAGDVVGLRAGEKQHGVGDFLRIGKAPERDCLEESLAQFLRASSGRPRARAIW